jgi:hypothetical protein
MSNVDLNARAATFRYENLLKFSQKRTSRDFRVGAISRPMHRSKTPSFDHLVGAGEQGGRESNAKGLGGLEVEDEFDIRGLLYRQVGRLLAPEDAADPLLRN